MYWYLYSYICNQNFTIIHWQAITILWYLIIKIECAGYFSLKYFRVETLIFSTGFLSFCFGLVELSKLFRLTIYDSILQSKSFNFPYWATTVSCFLLIFLYFPGIEYISNILSTCRWWPICQRSMIISVLAMLSFFKIIGSLKPFHGEYSLFCIEHQKSIFISFVICSKS